MTKVISVFLAAVAAISASCAGESTKMHADAGKTTTASETEKIVTDSDAVKQALNIGAVMPSFTLKDADGKDVSSSELMKKGNLVVVFYRGSWCPFCNRYLQSLQASSQEIKDAGGEIVAISVETPEGSTSVAQKNELKFTVLSDPNLDTARKFGIVYQLPKETDEKYKSRGLDVAEHNQMEKAELPLGATYIVDKSGKIVYAYLDTDYQKRAEPPVIIEELNKIKSN